MRKLLFLLTCISVGYSCNNHSERVISLAKTVDTTYQSVVAILRVDSTGKKIMAGSGVLIHPNVILTAGHINYSNVNAWDKSCSLIGYVSFGNNALQSNDLIPFNWLKDVVTHPDHAELLRSAKDTTIKINAEMFTDIGLIFLTQPVLNMPLINLPDSNLLSKIGKDDLLIGSGYGYHLVDTIYQRIPRLVDGLRRKWQLSQVTLVNDLWLKVDCDPVTNLPYIGIFDSGAPLLLNNSVVVGIWGSMDDASEPCLYSSWAARIDNPKVLKWIQDCIKLRDGNQTN